MPRFFHSPIWLQGSIGDRRRAVPVWMGIAWLGLLSATVMAATGSGSGFQEVVISVSPLPGMTVDLNKVPSHTQSLDLADLTRQGVVSVSDALNSQVASVTVNDNLDDRFQPDILYRGFEASPVLGTPQGLAVYQNGVRINEAFGDVVNWDLIPDVALSRVEVTSANPLYGLNALGGAIIVHMKDGNSYQGTDAQVSLGSFGGHTATWQTGGRERSVGWYVAVLGSDEVGWRDHADNVVRQVYAVASHYGSRWSTDLSLTWADNRLNGLGAAPVPTLALDRAAVFTGPQWNENQLVFSTLHLALSPSPTQAWQSVGYLRHYRQSVSNGNSTVDTACTPTPLVGSLCQADGITPLSNAQGALLPDLSDGGRVLIGENNAVSVDTLSRGISLQMTDSSSWRSFNNQLVLGATLDDARVDYGARTQVGVLSAARFVEASPWFVQTAEELPWTATPVALTAHNRDYGLYVSDAIDIDKSLTLNASARYNAARRDLLDLRGTLLTGHNRYVHLNPAMGITYQLSDGLTVYGGLSENNRTPTASEIECSDPLHPCLLPSSLAADPPVLKQVVAQSAEGGLRGSVRPREGARVNWNVGVFKTNVHDDIYGVATSLSSGFFKNIALTRRQGLEAGIQYVDERWSASLQLSDIGATFQSPFVVSSPSNPYRSAADTIQVAPGDELPGNARRRVKANLSYQVNTRFGIGAALTATSGSYYRGDESNQNARLPGYNLLNLHGSYRVSEPVECFWMVTNVLNRKFANFGLLGDPTGVGAPGVPTTGPVDPRFQSPGSPFAMMMSVRVRF